MDNVCYRCLFSIPSKVEMAEEQEYSNPTYLEEWQITEYWKSRLNNADVLRGCLSNNHPLNFA